MEWLTQNSIIGFKKNANFSAENQKKHRVPNNDS
jgi:hypothetical protein